jgi:hypothetical protein
VPKRGPHLHPIRVSYRSYNGGRTAEDFLKFLEEKIAADKGFARVAALDKIVGGKIAAGAVDVAALLSEVRHPSVLGRLVQLVVRAWRVHKSWPPLASPGHG